MFVSAEASAYKFSKGGTYLKQSQIVTILKFTRFLQDCVPIYLYLPRSLLTSIVCVFNIVSSIIYVPIGMWGKNLAKKINKP